MIFTQLQGNGKMKITNVDMSPDNKVWSTPSAECKNRPLFAIRDYNIPMQHREFFGLSTGITIPQERCLVCGVPPSVPVLVLSPNMKMCLPQTQIISKESNQVETNSKNTTIRGSIILFVSPTTGLFSVTKWRVSNSVFTDTNFWTCPGYPDLRNSPLCWSSGDAYNARPREK